eukprot:5001008-Lingulodinium_polyedra.AAC.1
MPGFHQQGLRPRRRLGHRVVFCGAIALLVPRLPGLPVEVLRFHPGLGDRRARWFRDLRPLARALSRTPLALGNRGRDP